jgi:hypothetical protein
MIRFTATILKFNKQGEKTGWTYIIIPEAIAQQLKPGNQKSFRVKGKLDAYEIKQIALLPMGSGTFIMPLNVAMRKGIGKTKGSFLQVQIQEDLEIYKLNVAFMECLNDEPEAMAFFKTFPLSHQRYFSKWIEAAKTEQTITKRIANAVSALSRKMNYVEMMQFMKKDKLIL